MNILIGNFLGDESVEQAGRELGIFRFFRNEGSRCLNRQEIEFLAQQQILEIEWLERGLKEKDGSLVYLKAEPDFDPLRADSRFQNLMHRISLPQ